MTTDRHWRQAQEVKIKRRSPENVKETLRLAADLLADYMGEERHAPTMALIREIDELRRDVY